MSALVTTSWLANRFGDPDTVILDATLPPVGVSPEVDVRAHYLSTHLRGAVFFDIEKLSDKSTPLPHMLPTPETFAREMSNLGIREEMTVVVYEQSGVFSAPRAWWMLRTFGAQHVYLLDGDLKAWIAAGLPTASGPVPRTRTTFKATFHPEAVHSFAEMQRMIAEGGQILDARPSGRFDGTSPEPRPGISSGHMGGAINVPFTELTANGRLKPTEQLLELFRTRNVDPHKPVTTTCGSGVTAAVLALGLELCGAADVSLYDGSWSEFAGHPEAVIEKTSQAQQPR